MSSMCCRPCQACGYQDHPQRSASTICYNLISITSSARYSSSSQTRIIPNTGDDDPSSLGPRFANEQEVFPKYSKNAASRVHPAAELMRSRPPSPTDHAAASACSAQMQLSYFIQLASCRDSMYPVRISPFIWEIARTVSRREALESHCCRCSAWDWVRCG